MTNENDGKKIEFNYQQAKNLTNTMRNVNIKLRVDKDSDTAVLEGYNFHGHWTSISTFQAGDETAGIEIRVGKKVTEKIKASSGNCFEFLNAQINSHLKRIFLVLGNWSHVREIPESEVGKINESFHMSTGKQEGTEYGGDVE